MSGSLTGYVGDPALTISGALTPVLTDTTGLHVDRPVTWQAQELASAGVQVVDNTISFTAAGTFHVRAVVDGVYSPWIAVTALPKRALTSIVIADPDVYKRQELEWQEGMFEAAGRHIEDCLLYTSRCV